MDPNSDGSVILAITDLRDLLLIRQPERRGPRWKMPGETIEIGEPVLSAVVRGALEETQLMIPFDRATGIVGDEHIKVTKLTERPRTNKDGLTHFQYFYGIVISTEALKSLGGKCWREMDEEAELIETKIFPLSAIDNMTDFLDSQKNLIRSMRQPA
ncbi:MAG: NUDIX hydrolase [Patescibacteria group bacterium]|nr:NUDIX hydrolase [Patescibacteria group bacterium]